MLCKAFVSTSGLPLQAIASSRFHENYQHLLLLHWLASLTLLPPSPGTHLSPRLGTGKVDLVSVSVPLTSLVLDRVLVRLKCQAPASQSTVVLLRSNHSRDRWSVWIVKARPRRYTRNVWIPRMIARTLLFNC